MLAGAHCSSKAKTVMLLPIPNKLTQLFAKLPSHL